jgi:hypothetical protein
MKAQDASDQAVVTIIGDDPVEANNAHDFVNTNPYDQSKAPPQNQKVINDDQEVIIPSIENGFHMRFEITYSKPVERLGGAAYVSSSSEYDDEFQKAKKRTISMNERKFNAKKKLRKWLPQRKKKYRPTICGRF